MYNQREIDVTELLFGQNIVLVGAELYTNKIGAALYHNVTERTVNNWLTTGKLDGINVFGIWIVKVKDVMRFKSRVRKV